jgi:hypothetical protein
MELGLVLQILMIFFFLHFKSECNSPQRNREEELRAVLQSAMLTVLRKKKEEEDKKKTKKSKDGNATDSDEEQQGTCTVRPHLTTLLHIVKKGYVII